MPKLGDKVDSKRTTAGAPPVILAAQPNSYVVLKEHEELKQWEADLRERLGVRVAPAGLAGTASESCSGGCSDDCDMA